MESEFTAVFCRVHQGYVGLVEELPGANSQSGTLEEARANLREAIELVLQANRDETQERLEREGIELIRERLKITA